MPGMPRDCQRLGGSGGGRLVVVNLMLDTEETREAGLDTHICELQLVLQPLAQLLVRSRPLPSANAALH